MTDWQNENPLTDEELALVIKPAAIVREWRKAQAELERAKAELERMRGDLEYLIRDCCGEAVGTRFCESFGCSTLKQILEGSVVRWDEEGP